jgi:hypothetical protein
MKKSNTNLIIDAIMFVTMMAVTGLGLLMKYVLIPGYKRAGLYDNDIELYFWGLTRHQWGTIHLCISCFLLFLLALHIILHWNMIICIFRKMIVRKEMRIVIGLSIGLIIFFVTLIPFIIHPEIVPIARQHKHSRDMNEFNHREQEPDIKNQPDKKKLHSSDTIIPEHFREKSYRDHTVEVYGYMSLIEVADKNNISVEKLAARLGIPVTKTNINLGKLRKIYSFYISDVKNAIVDLKNDTK